MLRKSLRIERREDVLDHELDLVVAPMRANSGSVTTRSATSSVRGRARPSPPFE
jgi:hypothetical protein